MIMEGDWNASEFLDEAMLGQFPAMAMGSPDHPLGGGGDVSGAFPPPPPSALATAAAARAASAAPTMADLAAAYWRGRATEAMASASVAAMPPPAAAPAFNFNSAPAATTSPSLAFARLDSRSRPLSFAQAPAGLPPAAAPASAVPVPYPSGIGPSAAALTANLATASALATTEALNAQLLRHWLRTPTPGGGPAAGDADPWGEGPGRPAAFPPPFSALGALDPSPLSPLRAAELAAPPAAPLPSSPPWRDDLASLARLLLSDRGARGTTTAGAEGGGTVAAASSSDALGLGLGLVGSGPLAAHDSLGVRGMARAPTAAMAAAAPPSAATVASAAGINSGRRASSLPGLLDFDQHDLSGDADSIGTVDPCDSDDEDNNMLLSEMLCSSRDRRGGTRTASSPEAPPATAFSVDVGAPTAAPSSATAAAAGSQNNEAGRYLSNGADGGDDSVSTTPAAPPAATDPTASTQDVAPRRSRRQAAVRGLERISTALATHGMGGSDSEDFRSHHHRPVMGTKTDRSGSGSVPVQGRAKSATRKKSTRIEIPSNKDAEVKDEEKGKEKGDPSPPTCCICLDVPTKEELASIDGCSHPFCFVCIEKWADQENTCPLCKARFVKIDRVNRPRKRKAGGDEVRTTKRVRHRDQRADVHNFVNPLEGIFASIEANGTWPTHIAQLLFSGLGGSTLGGGRAPALAGTRRSTSSIAAASSTTSALAAAAARRHQQRRQQRHQQRLASAAAADSMPFHYQYPASNPSVPAAAASRGTSGATTTGNAVVSGLLGHVQPLGGSHSAAATAPSRTFGARSSFPHSHLRPESSVRAATAAPPHHQNPFALETSPWSTSASVSVSFGPQGYSRSSTSATDAAPYRAMPTNTVTGAAAVDSWGDEEEERLLSSLSPSSYIRRLHRELESGSGSSGLGGASRQEQVGQYHFNTSRTSSLPGRTAGRTTSRTAFGAPRASTSGDRFAMFSAPPPNHGATSQRARGGDFTRLGPGRNELASQNNAAPARAAGRSVETVLEIGDSDDDDDVVEVIDVEALI